MANENKVSPRRLIIGGALLTILMIAGVLFLAKRQHGKIEKEASVRKVAINKGVPIKYDSVGISAPLNDIELMGEARPFLTATLYAKTSGYINRMLVDKGDKVKKGQLLATIISPETDEALSSAKSDLENKRRILNRDTALVRKQYISVEEEQDAETSVRMAEANVRSLEQQQQYKNITAPFSGTVTERFADPGALVQNATTSQVAALPLVTIAKLDEVRIYVYVEQQNASFIKPGYPVTISLAEKSGKLLKATITRQAGQLDPQTRMELVEIDRDNKDQQIVPGSFVTVHLNGPATSHLQISSDALIIKGNKYFAAVIDKDSTLHFKPIEIGENSGVRVIVYSGLDTSEKVALNVRSDLSEGAKVRPVKQEQ